jgi:hypothetical protein
VLTLAIAGDDPTGHARSRAFHDGVIERCIVIEKVKIGDLSQYVAHLREIGVTTGSGAQNLSP